jgi:hypothetical protein
MTDLKTLRVSLSGGGEACAWYDYISKRWRIDIAMSSPAGYVNLTLGPDSRFAETKLEHFFEDIKANKKEIISLAKYVDKVNSTSTTPEKVVLSLPKPKDIEDFLI